MPYFSIVVPIYNRENVVGRCLDSILRQRFDDYELILVDDGSTDGSVQVMDRYLSPKVSLIRHPENLGIGPARNTGFSASQGDWLIPFDSDDEMTDDALEIIFRITKGTPDWVGCVKFMVRYDTGELSPDPPFIDEVLDYLAYVKKIDTYVLCEGANIYKKPNGDKAIWPKDRSIETLFHLDWMHRGFMRTVPQVVRIYHRDAGNQFHQVFDRIKIIGSAPDMAGMIDGIMERHEAALKAHAPKNFKRLLTEACKFHLLTGNRTHGARYFLSYIRHGGPGRIWLYIVLGLTSRNLLAFVIGKVKQVMHRRVDESNF